ISIPFIALQWHGNGKLSGARIENNRLYYIIDQPIEKVVNDTLDKEPVVDMDETKPIFVKEMSINGEKIFYFGTTSRSHRLGINAYDAEGTFKGGSFYGNTHDYETAGLLHTIDNGLAIVGNTKVEARMSRICLFKLSEAEVKSMAGQ
ncbi:MAG: hypothetical protein GY950_34905, partial [bacterium]|nr:hypothetical protein [bacterium]